MAPSITSCGSTHNCSGMGLGVTLGACCCLFALTQVALHTGSGHADPQTRRHDLDAARRPHLFAANHLSTPPGGTVGHSDRCLLHQPCWQGSIRVVPAAVDIIHGSTVGAGTGGGPLSSNSALGVLLFFLVLAKRTTQTGRAAVNRTQEKTMVNHSTV